MTAADRAAGKDFPVPRPTAAAPESSKRAQWALMTEPSAAARELARRLEPRVNALARAMTGAWAAELPEFHPGPRPGPDDAAAAARRAARGFLRRLLGSPPDERTRAMFRERAAVRAGEGMPLHTLVRAYMIGARVLFEAVRDEAAGPAEKAALPEIALLLLAVQDEVVSDVVRAYQAESAAISSPALERRRALVRDLVLSGAAPAAATLDELGLNGGAAVLALRFGALPGSAAGSGAPAVAAAGTVTGTAAPDTDSVLARRLHRIQSALDHHFDLNVPTLLDAGGGYAIVPAAGERTRAAHADPALPSVLAEVWRDEVRIGLAPAAEPQRIPAAARTAAEILRLVAALGRPPGTYTLHDVLLEYHLSRHDEASEGLAALLDPLAGRPDLLHTARVFLDEQHDRRRTARRLGLHPNTVDNRLARVAELTGLDTSTPRGVTLLVTALALRDLG